jgi:thiamine transport system permease protein
VSWFSCRPTRRALALWLLPLGFVAAFFFYPLLKILMLSGEGGAGTVTWLDVWRPLRFTLFQAGLSTLLTLLVGLPAAFVFGRFDFPGKRLLSALTTLPFILPVVTAAAGFNALIGPNGWLNLLVMRIFGLENPPITLLNTLAAILLGHVFYNTAIVIRLVGSAWAGLDLRLEHAARVLGASPWQALKEVTLPLLSPAILSATLLVFLFDFTSFGVVLMLGGPHFATLEVEIYIQALQMLNLPLAGVLSLIQLGFTGLFIVLTGRLSGASVPLAPRFSGEGIRRPHSAREWVVVLGGVLTLAGLLLSPLLALVSRSLISLESGNLSLVYYRELFVNRRQSLFYVPPAQAALNSLLVAVLATSLALLLGMLAAYATRQKTGLSRTAEAALMLPLGASAVTLGLGFILTYGKLAGAPGFPVLLPVAHALAGLPFVLRALQPALASIPPSLGQAAAVLGASPWRVWCEVDLPILSRAALVGGVFAFTISLGEFGATTFLTKPDFPTLPIAIFRFLGQPGALNYGQAMAMATLLLLVCAAALLIVEKLNSK